MITRNQVADLRPGDVVEIEPEGFRGAVIRGPVYEEGAYLYIGGSTWLRDKLGRENKGIDSLTVISRARRPLYVNHDRTEPVPGDVVRDADDAHRVKTWLYWYQGPGAYGSGWLLARTGAECSRESMPDRLRLLVDGITGQAVTS